VNAILVHLWRNLKTIIMKRKLLAFSVLLSTQLLFGQDITSNLEAYFSFNDGTANVTAGQVTQAGSVFGAISDNDRFGNPNKAMFFDGINDYIDFGDLSNYQFGSNSFTIALWIYADMGQSGQGIPIGKRGFSGGDRAYMFGWDSNGPGTTTGELMLYYRDDSSNAGYSDWQTGIVAGNSWRHIAMVFDRNTDNLYFYVDGALESTRDISGLSTFNATGSSAGELMAGRSSEGGQYYFGLLDDIYVFRRALNQNDISALFNAADPILSINETNVNVLHAYPNPTKDQLTLSVTGNTAVQITDMSGTIVDRIDIIGQTNIDVSSYSQGVYFIRTAEGQTVKFIKE
jgi:hypothetical protein